MSAPSWLFRLARPGRRIAPLPGGRGYGVFAGPDRRRRPVGVLSERELRTGLSDGTLVAGDDGAHWVVSDAGLSRLKRLQSAPADAAEHFPAQHRTTGTRAVIGADGRMALARANLDASPLARYAISRPDRPALLERVHVTAGDRLRADYDASTLASRVTSDWSGVPRSGSRGGHDPAGAPARALDARTRVLDALAAVGPGLDRLLVNIVIRETGMERGVRDLDWPDKAGTTALHLALERLAIHYGLKRAAKTADPFAD